MVGFVALSSAEASNKLALLAAELLELAELLEFVYPEKAL